jgi:hypothetical protein
MQLTTEQIEELNAAVPETSVPTASVNASKTLSASQLEE